MNRFLTGCIRTTLMAAAVAWLPGCASPQKARERADRVAARNMATSQEQAVGRADNLRIESPADTLRRRLLLDGDLPHHSPASLGIYDLPATNTWRPDVHLPVPASAPLPGGAVTNVSLLLSLQIAARSSREYQAAKEALFRAALDLDLDRNAFRHTFKGAFSEEATADRSGDNPVDSSHAAGELGVSRALREGIALTAGLTVDLVRLLTLDTASSIGALADASISIPLLRGAGRDIVAEPLRRAELNALQAAYRFERYKRTFAVQVASEFLAVLQDGREVDNAEANYRRLVTSSQRARRLADAGRMPEFQFDQAVQDELRARTRWVDAQQRYTAHLDRFKIQLGLPTDATVTLDTADLDALDAVIDRLRTPPDAQDGEAQAKTGPAASMQPGPLELDDHEAIRLALDNRLDLRVAEGDVVNAQHAVNVAADALRAELTLLGKAQAGARRSAASDAARPDAEIRPDEGNYSALLTLDLPLERTAERNAYRASLIDLEQAVRSYQALEDQVKLDVRNGLRDLTQARENLRIQLDATALAEKRVHSTDLFLQAGRAQIRDVLESQEALLNAQNALTASVVRYRVTELEIQRDMGVLQVNPDGLWTEYIPSAETAP